MRNAAIAGLLFAAAAQAAAQQPAAFEVASIKPNKSDSSMVNFNLEPGGRFVAMNVSLQMLIGVAYGNGAPLPPNRMVFNAKWIGGVAGAGYATADRFDIVAKADGDFAQDQLPRALQTLLVERFKLVVHHDTKELPVYDLVMDRTDQRLGPRLKRSDVDCADSRELAAKNADGTSTCGFRSFAGSAKGRVTMATLGRFFTNVTADHRPVENRTGASGTFDFELEWAPEVPVPADAPPGPPVDPNGPSIFTAIKEQLGLRLEPATQPLDILVVDHAEPPTEN